MSERELEHESTKPMAAEAVEHSHRDKFRHSGGINRLAALVAVIVGIVFIVAVIFWSGFVLGASAGHDYHEGHEGRGQRSSEMTQDGPG